MCGVVGLVGSPDAAREAFLGLTTLQHRGQDAAGILSLDQDGFHRVKNLGLVESVFSRDNMESLTGNVAVGHARYSTVGRGDLVDVQPFLLSYPYGIGLVHNGNIVNTAALARELKLKHKRHLMTQSDSEIILNLLAQGLADRSASVAAGSASRDSIFEDICAAVQKVFDTVTGSFSIVSVIAGHGLVAFRDPHGIRPLVWGRRSHRRADEKQGTLPSGEAHMVASESVALSFLGYDNARDLAPGELLFIDLEGNVQTKVLAPRTRRPCMFEWVYFASPESVMDQVPVYGARIQLGKNLAELVKGQMQARGFEADLIVPVPETSRIAAIALAEDLGVPYREVLIKNRYIKRTFILDSQDKRQKAVNLKLSPVRSEIQGKRVLLVDDSIVRGTTSRKIIDLVRQAGAKQVYFVSTCPPIQNPCYYGIDFPDRGELIASGRDQAAIEKELGADLVVYQDEAGLKRSIQQAGVLAGGGGFSGFDPCMACLDGRYPTDVADGGGLAQARRADRERRGA